MIRVEWKGKHGTQVSANDLMVFVKFDDDVARLGWTNTVSKGVYRDELIYEKDTSDLGTSPGIDGPVPVGS